MRSLIAIELKIGEFEAEYAGKMQMYLTALDEQVKLPDENPSIGIIICKSKDKMYVEYALEANKCTDWGGYISVTKYTTRRDESNVAGTGGDC